MTIFELQAATLAAYPEAKCIVVDFSGYGDSGQTEDVWWHAEPYDSVANQLSEFGDPDPRGHEMETGDISREWLELADGILDGSEYDGYQNDDGGRGNIAIDLHTGRARVACFYYETVSDFQGCADADLTASKEATN